MSCLRDFPGSSSALSPVLAAIPLHRDIRSSLLPARGATLPERFHHWTGVPSVSCRPRGCQHRAGTFLRSSASQIVLLCKHRWDIEKIFHQFKSKMSERKSCASSLGAKRSHAIFECLAHNLLLLFEQYLGQSEGMCDELEVKKRQGRAKAAVVASAATGIVQSAGNFINTALARATPTK